MEVKPIPKPRSTLNSQPVPAPRTHFPPPTVPRSTSPSLSTTSEKSDGKSSSESRGSSSEKSLFRSFGSSSRQLKEEISEKMTVKGRAVISSTRNASIRLEKSVKSLLTRRLTSSNDQDSTDGTKNKDEERCVSMPVCDDIFSSISFYSPLQSNLKSMRNEEDLTEARYSPPPPVYPPPPLPDESIYDELQSVTSGGSSRYDTLSSTVSDRLREDSDGFGLVNISENCKSDSDQSLDLSEAPADVVKRLSRSDSWTFYHSTPEKGPVDRVVEKNVRELNVESKETENHDIGRKECEESKEPEVLTPLTPAISVLSIRNSLYENWTPRDVREDDSNVSSKSVLFEFDPFAKSDENTYGNYENNDLMLLEALLATSEPPSSDGSLADLQEQETESDEHENEEKCFAPPAVPRRYDSLPKHEYDEVEIVEVPQVSGKVSKSPALLPKLANLAKKKQPAVPPRKSQAENTQTTSGTLETPVKSPTDKISSVMQKFSVHVRPNVMNFMKNKKLLRVRGDSEKRKESEGLKMRRPVIEDPVVPVCHRGMVYRPGVGMERARDLVVRAAVLSDQKITFYADKAMTTVKETLPLDSIQSVHLLQDVKVVDGETVHCIAVSTDGKPSIHVFYAKSITERRIWAQRILEALTPVFPIKYTSDLTRAGWAYLKEGVSGSWFSAWILLQQRTLIYTRAFSPVEFETLDLRKARCILLRDQEGPISSSGNIPVVVIDGGRAALHLTAPGNREVPAWRHALYQAATTCGPALHEQQLTQENVPVIIDKCINFIYAHGIMSEGIYRKGGSSSAVVRLLETFRKDAWATQITRGSYSEHDVATVLRRFLRDLPDPLLPASIHDPLCRAIDICGDEERATAYRTILFPVLNRVSGSTLRRILAHLHFLSQQSSKNLMTVENISAVWGPTLMHAGGKSAEEWNRSETIVVGDLIRLYPKLYQLSAADLIKEAKILEVLERHHASNNGMRSAPSGDLKIWIYLFEKEGECCNVTIGPQKTASDICKELAGKTKIPAHELSLDESILDGTLQRPLHHAEKVLEVVVRWGYCDPEDRKDNILILKKNSLYRDIVPRIKPPMTVSGELKFADTKSKYFKSHTFEFSQAKLHCYKDKACAVKLHEWKIEDIIWYLGHEPKRNPQTGWSITFIVKNEERMRTKDCPFFGYTLAGASVVDQYRWLAAMLFGEHQMDLFPSAVNLMDP
ncbi:arf-GAP with Rho-GAP domain, ANK repeat and PH domain-containing protein 1 [Diachasmimorpha longicaudata]|uniref:arf-GAP with Rho-GAP domain, ANK repeat and PH domain-containing protein 1 n=1 Tax=Diachasmimorpha longicaudata TaxID=58733 RepID=UPI0030B87B81